MATTGKITRTSLSLGDLTLSSDPYEIADPGPDLGGVSYRRSMVTSPFVHGAIEVNAVKDLSRGTIEILVLGDDADDIKTHLTTLITAFSQVAFYLYVSIDGSDYAWSCYRADYAVVFDKPLAKSAIARARFGLFRQPIAYAGPF